MAERSTLRGDDIYKALCYSNKYMLRWIQKDETMSDQGVKV